MTCEERGGNVYVPFSRDSCLHPHIWVQSEAPSDSRAFGLYLFIPVCLSVMVVWVLQLGETLSTSGLFCKCFCKHEVIALTNRMHPNGTSSMARMEKDLETTLHEKRLKGLITFNLEEKMIIPSKYLKSYNEQDEADIFHVGF